MKKVRTYKPKEKDVKALILFLKKIENEQPKDK